MRLSILTTDAKSIILAYLLSKKQWLLGSKPINHIIVFICKRHILHIALGLLSRTFMFVTKNNIGLLIIFASPHSAIAYHALLLELERDWSILQQHPNTPFKLSFLIISYLCVWFSECSIRTSPSTMVIRSVRNVLLCNPDICNDDNDAMTLKKKKTPITIIYAC